jgi:Tfp pilus assembly protein PilF
MYAAKHNPLALQYYENALRLEPQREDALYARARLLQDLGKIDAAITEYEKMIQSNPKCERCYYNIGALLLEIKKEPKKALEKFSKAIEAKPDYLEAYFARAYTYSVLKDKESAKADYNMCLQIQPNYPPALDGLNGL